MASFGGNTDFPSISTRFHLDWSFASSDTTSDTSAFGSSPNIAFDDITLNTGDVISKFAGPILQQVDAALGPIKPVLDVLETPLPVISQLAGTILTCSTWRSFSDMSPETQSSSTPRSICHRWRRRP